MKRFQNKVAESSLSLPVSVIVCILIWFAAGLVSRKIWVPFLLTGFTTYLIAEMNNRNSLLRIRSRMMSCVYIVFATLQAIFVANWQLAAVQTIIALCIYLLLSCYKDRTAVSSVFAISLLLSAGSILWVNILYFLPIAIILLCVPLYAISLKAVSATIMGLLLPYWSLIPYFVYEGNTLWLQNHFKPLYDGSVLFNYSTTTYGQVIYFSLLVLLFLIGWLHFVRTAYKDKLKTRTLYDVFITLSLIIAAVVPIVPVHADYTLSMLTLAVSPMVAHYFSLTETKLTNIVFIITIAIIAIASGIALSTPYFELQILR